MIILSIIIYIVLVCWLAWYINKPKKSIHVITCVDTSSLPVGNVFIDHNGVLKSKQILYNQNGFIEVQNTISESLDKAIKQGIIKPME